MNENGRVDRNAAIKHCQAGGLPEDFVKRKVERKGEIVNREQNDFGLALY